MKTIIIYTETSDLFTRYTVMNGDYRHLNDVLINSGNNPAKEQELYELIFNTETGFHSVPFTPLTTDEFKTDVASGLPIIVCGFLD